jgi:hypothetical protein
MIINLPLSLFLLAQSGQAHGSLELVQADDQSFAFEVTEDDLVDLAAGAMKVGGSKMRRASRQSYTGGD